MNPPPTVWSLSGFGDEIDPDPRIQVAVLKALGAQHIEVRSAWGTNVVDLADDQVAELAGLFGREGMRVSALASPVGKVDVTVEPEFELARLRRVIEIARALGSPNIRIFSFFRGEGIAAKAIRDEVLVRMTLLAREAQRAGIVLLHENEKAIYGDTPQRILDLVESVGSPALRLAWDNANFVQVGVRPFTDGYALLREHIAYFQVKDAVASTGAVVPAGLGDGELAQTIQALRDDGYSGFASLEPHLAEAFELGGFSGPAAFGEAARAFAGLISAAGVSTR